MMLSCRKCTHFNIKWESTAQFGNQTKPGMYKRRITCSTMFEKASFCFGFSPIYIQFSDSLKSLVSRINEAYVFFNKKYRYFIDILLKKTPINFIYKRLFCCNHTCYCVGMVSVTEV